MFSKTIAAGSTLFTVVLGSAALFSQQKPVTPSSSAGLELPVIMRQNVAAGTTPVGSTIQARLVVATLVNRVVVPQDAVLSGKVTESEAKSATTPSRLAVRMDSAQWKNGSTPIHVYLTAWYYPVVMLTDPDLSSGLPDAADPGSWAPSGTHRSHARSQTHPSPATRQDTDLASPPSQSGVSNHRVLMKEVESTRSREGAITLTSKRVNIKLDKQTTYVFAGSNLLPTNQQAPQR